MARREYQLQVSDNQEIHTSITEMIKVLELKHNDRIHFYVEKDADFQELLESLVHEGVLIEI